MIQRRHQLRHPPVLHCYCPLNLNSDTLLGEGRTRSVRGGDAACMFRQCVSLTAISPLRAYGSTLPEGECRWLSPSATIGLKHDSAAASAPTLSGLALLLPTQPQLRQPPVLRCYCPLNLSSDTLLGEGRTRSVRGGDAACMFRQNIALAQA